MSGGMVLWLDSTVERVAVALALSDDSPCPYGFNECEAFDSNTGKPVPGADDLCRCRRLAKAALGSVGGDL